MKQIFASLVSTKTAAAPSTRMGSFSINTRYASSSPPKKNSSWFLFLLAVSVCDLRIAK